jgi:hypothetical protein
MAIMKQIQRPYYYIIVGLTVIVSDPLGDPCSFSIIPSHSTMMGGSTAHSSVPSSQGLGGRSSAGAEFC